MSGGVSKVLRFSLLKLVKNKKAQLAPFYNISNQNLAFVQRVGLIAPLEIHTVRQGLSEQKLVVIAAEDFRNLLRKARRRDMWSDYDVAKTPDRMIFRQWLLIEHIQHRLLLWMLPELTLKCIQIQHIPPAEIEQHSIGFHPGQNVFI